MLAGPIPVRILRAAQFHEFVPLFLEWGRQGDVIYVPKMRTQLVAARTVAEALAELAGGSAPAAATIPELAGPREESLVDVARLVAARRGDSVADRGSERPGRPRTGPLGIGRPATRPRRRPRRPDVRAVARLDYASRGASGRRLTAPGGMPTTRLNARAKAASERYPSRPASSPTVAPCSLSSSSARCMRQRAR